MANAAGNAQERGGDRWRTLPAAADVAPVVAREVAGDPPDMAFTRNEVLRETLGGLYGGRGGYWEDSNDYEWYAGI